MHYGMLIFLIFFCGSKYNNTSSKDFPLVSGIINIAKNVFNIQNTANIDQTISTPKFAINDGYILQIINHMIYPHVCTTPFITPETYKYRFKNILLNLDGYNLDKLLILDVN